MSSPFYHRLRSGQDSPEPLTRSMCAHLGRLCEQLVAPGDPAYIDYGERRADWWLTRPGGRRLPAAVECLATGGILVDDRYTQEAAAILRAIVEHRIAENCAGTNYGRQYRTWRDNPLDAGACSHMLAVGLDLLVPSLEESEVRTFGEYLVPFVDYILENPPDPDEERPDWNIALIGYVGTALLALVLGDIGVLDEGRCEESVKRGRHRARLFLDKGHDGDGAFYEGPAYGSASVNYLSPLALYLAEAGDRELVEHGGFARMVEGLVYEMIPGTGQINPLNDCGSTISVPWVALVAAQQGSGLAQWAWQRMLGWEGASDAQVDWTDSVGRFLLYCDPTVAPLSPTQAGLGRDTHFANRGLVDVRSGWEGDDFFLSFLCDVYPAGGHRQEDRNQFALHALGESFAVDSGYGLEPLPDTTEVLRLGALGEAHNLPLIHGRMQRRGPVSADGIVRTDLGGAMAYVESEAGESYGEGWRFRRRMLCLNDDEGEPACVVVGDYLTFDLGPAATQLSWLLHTDGLNSVALERDRLTIIGGREGNRCEVRMVTPWPGRWREERYLDHPRLRYDWFHRTLVCLVALAPHRAGEDPPVMEAEGSGDGCGLMIRVGKAAYTILTSLPEQTVSFGGLETDAEFAAVRRGDGGDTYHLLAAGARLQHEGREIVGSGEPLDYSTSQRED